MTQYDFEAKVIDKMIKGESDILKSLQEQFKYANPIETVFSEYGNGFLTQYYVEPRPELKKMRGMINGAKAVYLDEADTQYYMLKITDGYIDTFSGISSGETWNDDYESAVIESPPLDAYLATVDIRPKEYLSQSEFETKVLKQMASNTLENTIAMETQIKNFEVESREFTSVGFFTKFKPKKTDVTILPLGIVDQIEAHYPVKTDDYSTTQIFVLWKDEEGYIDTLEGFTAYGEWHEDYENAIF